VSRAIRCLRGGALFSAADDLTFTLSYLPDLVYTALDLLIDGAAGVFHVATPEPVTRAGLARVAGRAAASFGWAAPRPTYTPLAPGRGGGLPSLGDCLERFLWEAGPGRLIPGPADE
jgi:dTDP-4-dehydrorhamnose reductase